MVYHHQKQQRMGVPQSGLSFLQAWAMPGAQNPWAGELKTKRKVSKNGLATIPGIELKMAFLFFLI